MTETIPDPLKGDPARQAPDLHRGIEFQDWWSVEAWVNLKEGEALYLEGAEDFDVVRQGTADTVQTRATAAKISLRSDVVAEALLNFWKLQQDHTEKVITFRYLTKSGAAEEDQPSLGAGTKGLELWGQCAETRDESLADRLRAFLVDDETARAKLEPPQLKQGETRPQTLLEFLESASPKEVLEKLILRIKWDLRSEDSDVVRESVVMRVNAHGRTFGMRPLDCAPAIDRLYCVVAATAGQDGERLLTRADFLREFDDATQRILSPSEKAKQKSTADLIQEALGGGGNSQGLLLEAATFVQMGVPEPGEPLVDRAELVGKLTEQALKQEVLILHGSSGMGKTKAARLVAKKIGGDWVWADFQGVQANHLHSIVRLLASSLGEESTRNVALDNLNYSAPELQAIDTQLAAIVRLTRLRGGKVIITTQRDLSARTMQRLRAADGNVCRMPRLTEKEIDDFCRLLGCPADTAETQAKIVWLLTSGHPQLVHARLAILAQRGWPKPTAADFTTKAVEIDEEKEVARQLLDQAPGGDKELLFRLSLASGAFRRDHAVAIGQIAPALAYPADAFGRLAGPWIETVGTGYFRLSPLLGRAAIENWDDAKVRKMRSALARAILECPKKTLREADEVLTQGFAANDVEAIAAVVANLALSPMKARNAITNVLFWLPMIGRKRGQRAVAGNSFVNFLVRVTQFKIAAGEDRNAANELCAVVDREYLEDREKGIPELDSTKHRLLWLTTVLFEFEAIVAPAKLVQYWRETLELIPSDNEFSEMVSNQAKRAKNIPHMDGADFPGQLLLMMTARSLAPDELVEFAAAINGLEAKYREIALNSLKGLAFPLRLAIDRAWSNETLKKTADWTKVVESLEKLRVAVADWNIPMLDAFVRRAIAAVEDEYRHNAARAMEVLSAGTTAAEAERLLKDQRAVVLYRKQEHASALAIWREIIPCWPVQKGSPDLIPVYACQRATNAAGRIGDWPEVIRFCQHGRQIAEALGDRHYQVTFLADEAFGQWKNGDRPTALRMLREALEGFEKLRDDPSHPLRLHFARKMFEQVIKWCRSEAGVRECDVYEPPAGLCSRIDPPDDIKQYPVAPFDLDWYYLTDIEAGVHSARTVYAIAERRIPGSKYVAFRSVMSGAMLKERLRTRSLAHLVQDAVLVVNTVAESKAQLASGKTILEADAYPRPNYPDPTWLIAHATVCGLIVQAGADKPLDEFLTEWEKDGNELKRFPSAAQSLAEIRGVLSVSTKEAIALYLDQKRSEGVRFTAATRMSAESAFSLDEMFVGQAALFSFVSRIALITGIEVPFGDLVRKRWLERLRFPAAFLTPRLTIPPVKAACQCSASGLKLAAVILLAGKDAVSTSPPPELVQAWQTAVSSEAKVGA